MPKTLLLADDSVVIQKLVGLSFANEDVSLVTTDNGDDAIARARETRPDLILADVVMPGKSGYEVCQAVKSDPELCGVPVLLLTGTFEAFDESRAREVRSDGHITKPFEAQVLVDRVNELLSSASATTSGLASPSPTGPGDSAYDFFDESVRELVPNEPLAAAVPGPDPSASLSASDDESFAFHADPAPKLEPLTPEDDPGAFLEPAVSTDRGDYTVALASEESAIADATAMPERNPGGEAARLGDAAASQSGSSSFGDHELDVLSAAPATDLETDLLEDDSFGRQSTAPLAEREAPPAFAHPDTAMGETLLAEDLFEATPAPTPAAPITETPQPLHSDDLAFGFTPTQAEPSAAGSSSPFADDTTGGAAAPPPEIPDARSMAIANPSHGPYEAPPATSVEATPQMRDQVHEAIEKIAWEAFADLPDTIVRQVVERFEAIAWEVIPQMTESLIQEEIRRMKDGIDD